MESKRLSDILDSCPNDITLSFCGAPVTISAGKYLHTILRKKYVALSNVCKDKFKNKLSKLDSWKEADGIVDIFEECASPLIDEYIQDAISIGRYNVDRNVVINLCWDQGCFYQIKNTATKLIKRYQDICTKLGISIVSNEINKQNRTQFHVVTYSDKFTDAIKNEVKVSAFNAATGLAYDIFNNVRNEKSRKKAEEELNTAFKVAKLDFIVAAKISYINFFNLVILMLRDSYPDIEISEVDIRSADAIYNNLNELSVSKEQEYAMARQIISLYPIVQDRYSFFFKRFPEYRVEIYEAAQILGCDISNVVYEEISSYLDKTLDNSFESIPKSLNYLIDTAMEIRISDDYAQKAFDRIESSYLDMMSQSTNRNLKYHSLSFEDINWCKIYIEENIKSYDLFSLFQKKFDEINMQIGIRKKDDFYADLYLNIENAYCNLIIKNAKEMLNGSPESLAKAYEYALSTSSKYKISEKKQKHLKSVIHKHFLGSIKDKISTSLNEDPKSVVNAEKFFQTLNEQCDFLDEGSKIQSLINKHRSMLVQKFIDENIGETVESAKKCDISFEKYAKDIGLSNDEYENYHDTIKNTINERDTTYRTIEGIQVKSQQEADEIRNIIQANPDVFDKEYTYKERTEVLSSIDKLNSLMSKYDNKLTDFFTKQLNVKLQQFDIEDIQKLINNPPKMVYHADYEALIQKIENSPLEESAKIEAIKKYKNRMQTFESSCNTALAFDQSKTKKNLFWWFDGEMIVVALIFSGILAIIANALCKFVNFCWEADFPGFTAILRIIIIIVAVLIEIFIILGTGCTLFEPINDWKKLTNNGKYKLTDISKIKEFDAKALEEKYPAIKDTPPPKNVAENKPVKK